jgi:uncharacterized repeat protein (TIGR04076 family)
MTTHFTADSAEAFDWKEFQKHMGFSDEETEQWKNHPKKGIYVSRMCTPSIQKSTLIIEVVESHGCANGMKVGDRLYFEGCGLLDTKRSSRWCGHALGMCMPFSNIAHNLIMHGKDPNAMIYNTFPCGDSGSKYGWGQVKMKAYVVDESKGEYKG